MSLVCQADKTFDLGPLVMGDFIQLFCRERELRQSEIRDGADRAVSGAIEEVIEAGFQAFALLAQGYLHVEHLGFFQARFEDVLLHPLTD